MSDTTPATTINSQSVDEAVSQADDKKNESGICFDFEYWNKNYDTEIKNYESHGDVGEIWFDEDSQNRVISWILKNDSIELYFPIIDIGCGNGMMLIELAREGFSNLTGVDYSPKAIQLAESIAKDQDMSIKYKVVDMLSDEDIKSLGIYKIAHDKGTYDAVTLNPDEPEVKKKIYIDNVHKIIESEGILIITSCNWTEEELMQSFDGKFKALCVIPTPSFKFGGKVGNVVTSIVFKKV